MKIVYMRYKSCLPSKNRFDFGNRAKDLMLFSTIPLFAIPMYTEVSNIFDETVSAISRSVIPEPVMHMKVNCEFLAIVFTAIGCGAQLYDAIKNAEQHKVKKIIIKWGAGLVSAITISEALALLVKFFM